VPLNHEDCIIDLIKHLKIPVILVSQNYLGSINHTLLSINALKSMGIPVAGLIFNGKPNAATEAVIEKMGEVRILGKIEELDIIDKAAIRKAGERLDLTTL
jgi:dethiobiotin synthetase